MENGTTLGQSCAANCQGRAHLVSRNDSLVMVGFMRLTLRFFYRIFPFFFFFFCIVDMHSTSSTISHTALAGNANSVALNSFITQFMAGHTSICLSETAKELIMILSPIKACRAKLRSAVYF